MCLSSDSGADAGDLDLGERLPMTTLAAVVLAAPELEDDDLLRAVLRHDLGRDLRALHEGLADRDLVAADHQHFLERDARADIAGELLDAEAVAFRNAVLLTAGLDHCVHM